MFVINFFQEVNTYKIIKNADGSKVEKKYLLHCFEKQMKLPYLPVPNTSVKFALEGYPDDNIICDVEHVCLNTLSREFEITLCPYSINDVDFEDECCFLEEIGFSLLFSKDRE